MAEVVVGIHQPNFLPWLGYFDKLASSDVFVLLDTVKFSRGARTNRVQVLAGTRPLWLTVPVRRPDHGEPRIADALINDGTPWRRKAVGTLHGSYGRQPGFEETLELVQPVLDDATDRLAVLNEHAIRRIAAALALDRTRVVRASELEVKGASSEHLAGLVHALGGTVYLSGSGADGYLDATPFAERGIEVRVQRFSPPEYPQDAPEPVHGLSIVDAMMSLGVDGVRELLQANGATA